MKRCFLLATVLLALVLLWGCVGRLQQPTAETTMPSSPADEDDVFYFSHGLEFNRLYSQRLDGSGLTLVRDEICYDVKQAGDTVYYLNDDGLAAYQISTGQSSLLAADVFHYCVSGNDLVYAVFGEEQSTMELTRRDLATGEETLVVATDVGIFDASDGYLYYCTYDWDTDSVTLFVYDMARGEHRELLGEGEYSGFHNMVAGPEGVYTESGDLWIFVRADGTAVTPLDHQLSPFSRLLSADGKGMLYVDYGSTVDYEPGLHYVTADGNDTLIMRAEKEASLSAEYLKDGYWLIAHQLYTGWGDVDQYGYYENYSMQTRYLLLDADLRLTPLDVAGQAGAMFRDGDFPVLDSSTARIPVTTQLYDLFVMGYGYEGQQPLCSTTHGAWLNIADRKADLALLAAPTPEEREYLESKGVEVEMKLYGGDGLVFIGNAANPVTELTHEQILAIYRGEITSWKELGGPDQPIRAYYRDDQSGSQRLFESLVLKEEAHPDYEALGFPLMDSMSSLVNIILDDPYAIGYSILTYLDDVYAQEELKVFSVNGATPSVETVKDQSYPYNTKGYLVIRSDEPKDSPARRLFDWFGGSISEELLLRCGVSPLHE